MKFTSIILCGAITATVLVAQNVEAAVTETTLVLVPHCSQEDRSSCALFDVQDATHLRTPHLSVGDLLDIDVVVRSSEPQSIDSIKAWLSYDDATLEARSVELTKAMQAPYPGESTIDAPMRTVKIGGATNGSLTKTETPIARVTFRIKAAPANGFIRFSGFMLSGIGTTAVNGAPTGLRAQEKGMPIPCVDKLVGCRGTATPLLLAEPSALTVVLQSDEKSVRQEPHGGSAAIPVATAADTSLSTVVSESVLEQMRQRTISAGGAASITNSSSSSSSSSVRTGVSSFGLLQVQNVSVTTRDRDLYIGWQQLKSSELKGYNVYYGTTSGRYIQRKTLPASASSHVLRDLEPGTTYYIAITGLNQQDKESAFSQEVSVSVGKPETSTAPLTSTSDEDEYGIVDVGIPEGKSVPGETGLPESIIWALILSAAVGTAIAAHRQFTISRLLP